MFDNLFDKKFTYLDAVKILLLIVTMFSTWNVVDLMTPNTSLAFIREIAAVGVVEGAFIGFEYATAKAKTKRQTDWATVGFFCSLVVIGLFAATSGLLEFGGANLLAQSAGNWLSLAWTVKDVVMVCALAVLVVWIVTLASIYRVYSLNDPDKKAELQKNEIMGDVAIESNNALKSALGMAQPIIAAYRAMAQVKEDYKTELAPEQINGLQSAMNNKYKASFENAEAPTEEPTPSRSIPQPTPKPAKMHIDMPETNYHTAPRPEPSPLINYLPEQFAPQLGTVERKTTGAPINIVVDKIDPNGRTIVFEDNGKYLGKFANRNGEVWTSFWQSDKDLATRQPEQFSQISPAKATVQNEGNEAFLRAIPADPQMPIIPDLTYHPVGYQQGEEKDGPATSGEDFLRDYKE